MESTMERPTIIIQVGTRTYEFPIMAHDDDYADILKERMERMIQHLQMYLGTPAVKLADTANVTLDTFKF